MFKKNFILQIGFNDINIKQVLEYIDKILKNSEENRFFVTPNPEVLVMASNDNYYREVLNSADLALADGMGVILASKTLGRPIRNRITGVDLVGNICNWVSKKPITVGFLGGGLGVAEKTSECLKRKYPGLEVAFAQEKWTNGRKLSKTRQVYVENDHDTHARGPVPGFPPASAPAASAQMRAVGIPSTRATPRLMSCDILFVAFGSPKQEIWIYENLQDLPSKLTIGVGGAFDFISGKVRRAPVWVQKIGLEWLFRLITQPWRARRQISLIKFMVLILLERFKEK